MEERINDGMLRRILGENDRCGDVCRPMNVNDDHVKGWGICGYPLAMVYSPVQEFSEIYELDRGFHAGTIFKELDLNFKGTTVSKGGCCRG